VTGTAPTPNLTNAALDVHHDDPGFGYRFIADELALVGSTTAPERMRPSALELEVPGGT
jgi:hypothetical protein